MGLFDDIVSGAAVGTRDKQREKIADYCFDVAKFMVTGVAFGSTLTLAGLPNINVGGLILFGLGALGLSMLLAALGLRELSRLGI